MPLAPSHYETQKDESLNDAESTVDDGQSVLSRDSEVVPIEALPAPDDSLMKTRFLWTQAGIDSLRREGRWEEYGRPQEGHELNMAILQVLQDTSKLEDTVKAKFFVVSEQEKTEESY